MSGGISGTDLNYVLQKMSGANQSQWDQLLNSQNSSAATTQTDTSVTATSEDSLQTASIDETADTSGSSEAQKVSDAYDRQIEKAKRQIADINRQMKQMDTKREQLLSQLMGPDVDISSIVSELNNVATSKNDLFFELINMNYEIEDMKVQKNIDIQSILENEAAMSQLQASGLDTGSLSNLANMPTIDASADAGTYAAQLGQSFVGVVNNDAQGNAQFTPGGVNQPWCADFVTSVTKRAWQAKGKTIPSGFGSSAVVQLQSWGQQKGVYLDTASGSAASKIAQNVKPGDIMIQQRNGASHTGIVTKVYSDGSFDTVEGNSSNAVKNRHYDASSNVLSGFVLMSKVA